MQADKRKCSPAFSWRGEMDLKVRIYLLENGRRFMGIGVQWLLRGIKEHGSLRQAAMNLGISYTKAFRMIFDLEKSLGYRILDRHRGGQSRDGAVLTSFGEEFIVLYEQFQRLCEDCAQSAFLDFEKKLSAIEKKSGEMLGREEA